MDDERAEAKHLGNSVELQNFSLPFRWERPSATIVKGGTLCVVLSRAELENLGLYHLQMFPSNSNSADILAAGGLVSSTQTIEGVKDALPVFKTKAVVDAELDDSPRYLSPVPARGRCRKQKALSMDEVGLYKRLYATPMYSEFEKNQLLMKETHDSAGMVIEERSEAMNVWQENYEAKFLLQMMPWELTPLPPLTTLENSAAVPFKWEEVPGKPKPEVLVSRQSQHPLRLPPRLHSNPSPLPLPSRNRRGHVMRILHIILPVVRGRKASTSVAQHKDESLLRASGTSEEILSPNSTLRGFDSQSQASSTSPDIPSTADLSLANRADHQFYSNGSYMECRSSYSNNYSGSYFSSPYTDFGPVDGPKGASHLFLAVENIKQTMKTWNRNKISGKRSHRSMDFDSADVWSPTLAVYYQQYGGEIDSTKKSDVHPMNSGGENKGFNPTPMQSPCLNSGFNEATSSTASFLSSSAPATPLSRELHPRTIRGLRKRIMDKIRKSYITAVQYLKVR